ncbi:hypothetical protein GEV90_22135 [Salmonella enterica]|nr:hypothetical protein [Salmonella enterica]EGA9875526.1 hypothetical protein [Salmonella enterica]EGL5544055.1 hypothetical protein [Salmonella enterica]EGM0291460.1 hypothetical protein [Salmonella enterica]
MLCPVGLRKNNWLIAHPSRKIIALNGHDFSEEALAYVDYLIANQKTISMVLADENEDDSIITILYKTLHLFQLKGIC